MSLRASLIAGACAGAGDGLEMAAAGGTAGGGDGVGAGGGARGGSGAPHVPEILFSRAGPSPMMAVASSPPKPFVGSATPPHDPSCSFPSKLASCEAWGAPVCAAVSLPNPTIRPPPPPPDPSFANIASRVSLAMSRTALCGASPRCGSGLPVCDTHVRTGPLRFVIARRNLGSFPRWHSHFTHRSALSLTFGDLCWTRVARCSAVSSICSPVRVLSIRASSSSR